MRVLFDQATPVPIRRFLIGHTVSTAAQQRWDTLKNGDLLTVAEQAGFEVVLTTDKNMRYQQQMAGRAIAVVVSPSRPREATHCAVSQDLASLRQEGPASDIYSDHFICH